MFGKLVFVAFICSSLGLVLPPTFKICKRSDSGFNDCLKDAIQQALPLLAKGIPEFGVTSIKPLTIPSASIGEGKGAVHVTQKYNDFKINHLEDSKIQKVESTISTDAKGFEIHVDISAPEYSFDADYDFNGRILLLPITGNGKCLVRLKEVAAKVHLKVETFEKDGTVYTRVKDSKCDLDAEKVTFRFDNLFNGDERLGQEMNNVLNDNWKDVFQDIKTGYEDLLATVIQSIVNNIFTKVPYDNLFPK